MKRLLFLVIITISSCSLPKYVTWDDNIKNPDNQDYIMELNCVLSDTLITQEEFNDYLHITRKDMSFYKDDTLNIGFIQVIRVKTNCSCKN